ncbi:hypothetical protein DQM19_12810 [Lactiplantibacillus plantarum]|nr:hypothetical protein DQM19_12810 [Lactiplantibacillus plantarum]
MEGKRGSECLLKPVSNIDFNPTLVDVAVWHVFNRAPQLYRQAPQIKKPPCVTLVEVTGRAKIVY